MKCSNGEAKKMTNGQSKKLLLIRPMITNDDWTSKFSHPASADLKEKALAQGWEVTELECDDTNRINVENKIQNVDPDFIIHYDHGGHDKLFGQAYPNEAILECTGAKSNVNLLSSAVVSTVSCSSALTLGPAAVAKNTRNKKAYLGYNVPIYCEYEYKEYFTRAATAANNALLEGKTFQEAKTKGYQQYTDEIIKLLALNDPTNTKYIAVLGMLIDRDHLTLVGDGSAQAQKPGPQPQHKSTLFGRSIGPLGVPSALLYQLWKLREKYIRPEVHKKIHPII
jgi:hypothetical protein